MLSRRQQSRVQRVKEALPRRRRVSRLKRTWANALAGTMVARVLWRLNRT